MQRWAGMGNSANRYTPKLKGAQDASNFADNPLIHF